MAGLPNITPDEIEQVGGQIAALIGLGKPIEEVILGIVGIFRSATPEENDAMITATRAKILDLKTKADAMSGQNKTE